MSEISEKAKALLFAYSLVCAEVITKGIKRDEHDKIYHELQSYIAALEAENAALKEENSRLKQDPQPLEFWSEEKMQAYADNMGRSARNSSDTGEWKTELPEVEA